MHLVDSQTSVSYKKTNVLKYHFMKDEKGDAATFLADV